VNFPKFGDGRGYSIARLLRERYGYQGELRAVGQVGRDHLYYLESCGFDASLVCGTGEWAAATTVDSLKVVNAASASSGPRRPQQESVEAAALQVVEVVAPDLATARSSPW